jgi:hypothetical protein
MSDPAEGAKGAQPSLFGVLPDVVKGLLHKPPLLFGIGIGIVLVAVLGVTTNVVIVVIVAAALLLCLLAWVFTDAHARRQNVVKNRVRAQGATIKDSNAGVQTGTGAGSTVNDVDITDADVQGSNLGVSYGPQPGRKRR